jgi:uncharacterized membrane protein
MKSSNILYFFLGIMGFSIGYSLFFPERVIAWINQPELYAPLKFVHIFTATLFFANALIGSFWELRGLLSNNSAIVKHTYQTVIWLDAVLTAPCVTLAVFSGIALGTILGGVWSIGWLSTAFVLFFFSGFLWVVADIPTQYRIKKELKALSTEDPVPLSDSLRKLLYVRMMISAANTTPLIAVLFLMVFKPELKPVFEWFTL